ncbi:hypothetical protein SFUMM280S_08056 [Streptomyces fumanus]
MSHPDEELVDLVVQGWGMHPTGAYAQEVLAGVHVPDLYLDRRDMLPHAARSWAPSGTSRWRPRSRRTNWTPTCRRPD